MPLQILLMALWMYGFRYFYYPSVLMAIMIVGTAITIGLTHRQRQTLYKLFTGTRLVPYVRRGYVRATVGQRLVPGDVIVVQQGVAVCDMVLLRGNCLLEASRVSGEVRTQALHIICCSLACCMRCGATQGFHSMTALVLGFRHMGYV